MCECLSLARFLSLSLSLSFRFLLVFAQSKFEKFAVEKIKVKNPFVQKRKFAFALVICACPLVFCALPLFLLLLLPFCLLAFCSCLPDVFDGFCCIPFLFWSSGCFPSLTPTPTHAHFSSTTATTTSKLFFFCSTTTQRQCTHSTLACLCFAFWKTASFFLVLCE